MAVALQRRSVLTACTVLLVVVGLALIPSAEAKRKRKFDGDFEFAEEDESRNTVKHPEKKRWVHDPSSELCGPLNCKKKELCLLEDPWTAVCVSKKELHRTGDTVVPKEKLGPEEAARYSGASSPGAAGGLTGGGGGRDQDPFYDSDDEDDEEDSSQDVLQARCNPCPVVKPTFLCGTDNRTYSSLCRLDYHNCIHRTSIKVTCKGFCPCKDGEGNSRSKKVKQQQSTVDDGNDQQQQQHINTVNVKYPKNGGLLDPQSLNKEILTNTIDKYTFTPQDFSYDNKHYKYIKYTKQNKLNKNPSYYEDKERMRGDNDVIERKTKTKAAECGGPALQAMGDRLLDWFSVIMADSKRRQVHQRNKGGVRFPSGCKNEVRWMFHHLDTDTDSRLSLQELYDLEHDQNEKCIKPFLDLCDTDRDIFVTPHEWCKCFDKTDRPCAAVKRRISSNMLGVYVPECDSEGYYYHTQCHVSVGMCWCVDKHGVELPNSRTRGKPNCESVLGKNSQLGKAKKPSDLVSDDDEDGDDTDDEIEGSADQPLDF